MECHLLHVRSASLLLLLLPLLLHLLLLWLLLLRLLFRGAARHLMRGAPAPASTLFSLPLRDLLAWGRAAPLWAL